MSSSKDAIVLPEPCTDGSCSVEKALKTRRSFRQFGQQPLTLAQLGQLLWAAQGITHPWGFRTVPSAGGLFPLEVYVEAALVQGLAPGIYRYQASGHRLEVVAAGARNVPLASAALGQSSVESAAAVIVLAAVYERTTSQYGERGASYVLLEAGHVAQSIELQAASAGLGAVSIGAFVDRQVSEVLELRPDEQPIYLIAVGRA